MARMSTIVEAISPTSCSPSGLCQRAVQFKAPASVKERRKVGREVMEGRRGGEGSRKGGEDVKVVKVGKEGGKEGREKGGDRWRVVMEGWNCGWLGREG